MSYFPLPDYGYNSVYKEFNYIVLMQTSRCVNNCVFCAKSKSGHGKITMPKEHLKIVTKRIQDYSGYVSISGTGEVCTLNDLPERIHLLKNAWPNCTISLTTTLNIDHGFLWIKDLFDSGVDKILLSCYAHDAEDYKKLYSYNGFSSLCKNIEYIGLLPDSIGAKVNIRHFTNAEHLFNIRDYDKKWNKFKTFLLGNNIKTTTDRELLHWTPPRPLDGKADWELPTPCPVIWGGVLAGSLNILENMDVVPCCMFTEPDYVFGNLLTQSLDEIFSSESYNHFYKMWREMRPCDLPVCNSCQIYTSYVERDELARMAAWQARKLNGQKVIFWGAGESYRAYRSFFADCQPVAMLLDLPIGGVITQEIDGIPVYRPEDFLPSLAEPLPLVIFAAKDASPKILRKLKNKFASYKPSKLVICPANAHIEPPVQPFFPEKA